jgi:nitrate reductase cytochrome c-type subunit
VGSQQFAPLNAIALGFLENKEVTVTTTASAALFDVRTEFLYGVAESTAQQRGMSSVWSEESEVDDLRKKAEQAAFKSLVPEMAKTWQRLVKEYQVKPPLAPTPQ